MAKKTFSLDFNKKLYGALYELCSKFDNPDGGPTNETEVCVNVEGYEIEAEVEIYFSFSDDSFDHAFGTWNDPFAGYNDFCDVALISAKVYDDDNDYDLDVDAYDKQFVKTEHNGYKAGDNVNVINRYGRVEYNAVLIDYNIFTDKYRVKHVNRRGEEREDFVTHIRKCA